VIIYYYRQNGGRVSMFGKFRLPLEVCIWRTLMERVLIAYYSAAGTTERMAAFIGEGVRISGQEAVVTEIADLKTAEAVAGYDGYIFGAPTYSLDIPEAMKKFLSLAQKAGLKGKLGGAFGSYTHDVAYRHDTHAPAIIMATLQDSFKMRLFELGPLILSEAMVDSTKGMRACQDYGKVFGESISSQR
jgi:flavodoxin